MPRYRPKPGYVYLIDCDNSWYKIGYTTDLESRMRSLRWQLNRKGKVSRLICLIASKAPRFLERGLHSAYSHLRTQNRHNGMGCFKEFFKLSPEDIGRFPYWAEVEGGEFLNADLTLADADWLAQLRGLVQCQHAA